MKYNYDKSVLKGLSVKPFLNQVKLRNQKISEAPEDMPVSVFNANRLAASLHPLVQHTKITEVTDFGFAKRFVLTADPEKGTSKMAFFRAGQYVSVSLQIGNATLNKPYSICSSPSDALNRGNSSYTLTVKHSDSGYASSYILDNWKEGDRVDISGPLGEFYYQDLRDAPTVVALAGGSGITPFFSMASAIADGIEDFNITILYGSRKEEDILFKNELDEMVSRSDGKVRVIYVLSDEEKPGFEHGLLTAALIRKYAPEGDYSIFECGPKAMYRYENDEVANLELPRRRVRQELSGDVTDIEKYGDHPEDFADKEFNVTVDIRGKKQMISCAAGTTLLVAMERAGINAPSHCRSGKCGWCRSKLISGEYYCPKDVDGRRAADVKFNWIHPCCTFPLSDMEICVYPVD